MWAYSVAGLVVGFAIGATGVGGGSLMTPILILGFGLPPATAVGTDLLYAALTKSFGVLLHDRQGTVEWRITGLLALGSVPTTLLTIVALRVVGIGPLEQHVMTYTLGGAIIFTAVFTLFKPKIKRLSAKRVNPHTLYRFRQRWRTPLTILAGALLGIVVTLSSVGAGAIGIMILLMLYPGVSSIAIVGTDLAHAVLLTALAGIGHLTLGTTDLPVLGYMMLGSLPGIYLGTRTGFRLPDQVLRLALVSVLVAAGLGLII